jgi:hypothetical protein
MSTPSVVLELRGLELWSFTRNPLLLTFKTFGNSAKPYKEVAKKRPFLNNRQEYIQVLCTISVLLFRSHQWELKVAPIHCPKLDFGNTANKRLKNRRFELWIDLVASKAGSVKCRTMLPRINLETVSHFSKLCSHRGNLCQRQSYRNGYAWHKS